MPPNILLIMTDDQRRYPDGAGNLLTDMMPNTMAEFADRGTDYTNFHISSPVCAPARATLYSGLYASQHGAWTVLEPDVSWPTFYMFNRLLRANGYETGIVGKFTNWIDPADGDPLTYHFDFAFDIASENPTDPDEPADLLAQATTFINGADPGPWFLAFCPHIPHDPYSVTPVVTPSYPTFTAPTSAFETNTAEKVAPHSVSGTTRSEAGNHFEGQMEEVAALDEVIDDLFGLFTAGERDAMVSIYTSDNGFMWGEHGYLDKELPYRESTNVNFYLSYPDGGVTEGGTDTRLCSNIDIAPTILDIANIEADYEMPGRSLLLDGSGHPDHIYLEAPVGLFAGTPPGAGNAWRAIRDNNQLYIEWTDAGEWERYDTDTDPTEVAGFSTSVAGLQTLLESFPYQESGLINPLTANPNPASILVIDPVVPRGGPQFWVDLGGDTAGDDLSGGTRTSAGADGAVLGDSTDAPPGLSGSTSFDGGSGRVFVADQDGLYGPDEGQGYKPLQPTSSGDTTPTDIYTTLVWSKRASTGADAPLVVMQSYSLRWSDTTADTIRVREALSSDNFDLNNTYLDEWLLIGWVLNFDNNTTTIWANGTLIGSANIDGNDASQFGMVIGGAPTTIPRFHGKIARVAVYTRALTAAEHMTHYELGINEMNHRRELVLDDSVRAEGIDWGDAAIEQHLADHTIGSSAVDLRIPNRQIVVPISLQEGHSGFTWSTIRNRLQEKVGRIREEGGVIRRGPSDRAMFADIVNASLTLPDSWYSEHKDMDPEATLSLEALPDFYGHESLLATEVPSGDVNTIITSGSADGQYPGRTRAVAGTFLADRHSMIYAVRSRRRARHDDMYLTAGTAVTASGQINALGDSTSASDYVQNTGLTTSLERMVSLNPMGHMGPHRVFASTAMLGATATWTAQLQLRWATGFNSELQSNETVEMTMGTSGVVRLVDLGLVLPRRAKQGRQNWYGEIWTAANNASVQVRLYSVYVLPVAEGFGKVYPGGTIPVAKTTGIAELSSEGYWRQDGSTSDYHRPHVVEGTLPRMPAANEARVVEWIFRYGVGSTAINYGPKELPNAGGTPPTVSLFYRPSYLFPPR
jgi:arylsulfatase A-like enzyme